MNRGLEKWHVKACEGGFVQHEEEKARGGCYHNLLLPKRRV